MIAQLPFFAKNFEPSLLLFFVCAVAGVSGVVAVAVEVVGPLVWTPWNNGAQLAGHCPSVDVPVRGAQLLDGRWWSCIKDTWMGATVVFLCIFDSCFVVVVVVSHAPCSEWAPGGVGCRDLCHEG
jgi:hypothetical protein